MPKALAAFVTDTQLATCIARQQAVPQSGANHTSELREAAAFDDSMPRSRRQMDRCGKVNCMDACTFALSSNSSLAFLALLLDSSRLPLLLDGCACLPGRLHGAADHHVLVRVHCDCAPSLRLLQAAMTAECILRWGAMLGCTKSWHENVCSDDNARLPSMHKLEQVDSNRQMQQQADCIILCRLKWMLKHFIASSLHSSNTFDYVISRASPE